jgi:hypothetical protein
VKPLLDAEEFAGNRNGLGCHNFRISSWNSGQVLLLRAGTVHVVSIIPLDAVLLEGAKALVTFGQQGDPTLKFWRLKEAGPGCCLAIVKSHS